MGRLGVGQSGGTVQGGADNHRANRVKDGKATKAKNAPNSPQAKRAQDNRQRAVDKSSASVKSIAGSLSGPKKKASKAKKSSGHDFDFGRMDSIDNIRGQMGDMGSSLKGMNNSMRGMGIGNPADMAANFIGGFHDTVHSDPVDYDPQDGFDAHWGNIGDKLSLGLAGVPAAPVARTFPAVSPIDDMMFQRALNDIARNFA